MRIRPVRRLAFALVLAVPPLAVAQTGVKGHIESVTVYRGQALVTRAVPLPAALADAAGSVQEVIVTDLPSTIRPESLHAEAGTGVKVRSVSFRTRPVVQDTREEVRAIDARIEELSAKIASNQRHAQLVNENRAYLESLQGFVAPTATAEMTRGVLNADTIEKISGFLIKQRATLADEELKLGAEARQLQTDLQQAQRERGVLTAGSSRTVYEAVVLVAREGAGQGAVRLRYLVDGATWQPSYNIRAAAPALGKARDQMTLEYYASIRQMSGEDWSGVTMTLSTATPSLIAMAPKLAPMTISLTMPQPAQIALAYDDAKKDLLGRLRQVEQQRANVMYIAPGTAGGGGGGEMPQVELRKEADKNLNFAANDIQVLDLVANARVDRDRAGTAPQRASEEGLSVSYSIATKATLPSRAESQLVQIASIPVAAEFARIAAPVLTGYIYDEARAVNTTSMVLLAGPVTAYSDGAFVGSGDLPTVAAGQAFTAGFGIDSSLRASRELVERTETIQGGNRVVDLTYRLTVENFADAPAAIRLLDRLPKVEEKRSDIRLTLVSPGGDLCSDAEYLAGPRKDGILRWDVTVPKGATGQKAFVLEYKFRLEFDKQMTITGIGG